MNRFPILGLVALLAGCSERIVIVLHPTEGAEAFAASMDRYGYDSISGHCQATFFDGHDWKNVTINIPGALSVSREYRPW